MHSLEKRKKKKQQRQIWSNICPFLLLSLLLSLAIFTNKLPGIAVPVHRDASATRQLALAHEAQPWKHRFATSKTCTTWDV